MKKLLLSITMLFACVALFAAKPANWEKNIVNTISKQVIEGGELTEAQSAELLELYTANSEKLWDDSISKEDKGALWRTINVGIKKVLTPEQFKAYQEARKKK